MAIYYVRTDGNNTSTGTANTAGGAWLTVSKAASTLVAGDTVNIGAGTFAELVTETTSGSSGSPISYNGAGDTTIIGGFNVTGTYVTVQNVKLTGTGSGLGAFDGLIQLSAAANHFTGSYVTMVGTAATLTTGFGAINMTYPGPSDCTFDHLTVLDMNYAWFILRGDRHVMTNSTGEGYAGWDVFLIFGSDIVIRGNTILSSNSLNNPSTHPDLFQSYSNLGQANLVRNVILEQNVMGGTGSADDLQLGNIEDYISEGGDRISGWIIRNNVFKNIDRTLNLCAPGWKIYNNTFYRCGTSSGFVISPVYSERGHANDLDIRNNLFVECGTTTSPNQGWYAINLASDPITGTIADYNLVLGTGAGTTKDATKWTQGFGVTPGSFESHGINGSDPLFASGSTGDFRIQSGSPVIGAGVNLSASFTTDITGAIRTVPFDIGAYKYTAAGAPTQPGNPRKGFRTRTRGR